MAESTPTPPADTSAAPYTWDTGAPVLPPGVRTYHPRRGRLTADQHRQVALLLAEHGVPGSGVLDLAALFGNRPVVLEIGFGMGEAAARMARDDPGTGILAVDIHTPGVLRLLTTVQRDDLANVRVAHTDAVRLLRDQLPPRSLTGVRIFFPDPWPKAGQRKRRLVQVPVVSLLADRILVGGFVHLATDDPGYAATMLDVLNSEPLLLNEYQGYAPDCGDRPQTRYEARGRASGRPVVDLMFRRVAAQAVLHGDQPRSTQIR